MQCTSELWKLCSRTYCAPISIILELPPLKSVGLPGPSFIHLLFETQGWEVAILNWPLHVRRGRHPNAVSVLQHLRSCGHARFWSDGNSSLCKDIRALSNTHPLCVHRLEFLGECPSNPYLSSPLKFLPIPHHLCNPQPRLRVFTTVPMSPRSRAGKEAMSMRSTYQSGKPRLGGLSVP